MSDLAKVRNSYHPKYLDRSYKECENIFGEFEAGTLDRPEYP